jgi:CheY-like chemotaxis protein
MRQALEAFFQLLGHRARFVSDVASALQAAAEERFEFLLADIRLPDGDGWELLRQLDQAGRRPPAAVAMSA